MEEAYSGKKQNIQFSTSENVILEKVQNLEQAQIDVLIAVEVEEYDLIKVFTATDVSTMCGNGEEITNPCNDCSGQGNKQVSKKISVTIPKGVDDGTRIRLAGKGEAGTRGGATGDISIYKCKS